jgi:hypothetical protein
MGGAAASEEPGEPDFSCALVHPATMYDSLKALPGDIRTFVTTKFGPMAERGGAFNATDVIMKPAPSRRFIRAGKTGDTWFLWYEQGGIAYWKQIIVFKKANVVTQSRASWHDNLCVATDKLLGG